MLNIRKHPPALAGLIAAGALALSGVCLAAQPTDQPSTPSSATPSSATPSSSAPSPAPQAVPGAAAAGAAQALPTVCLDAESGNDTLIATFADHLRQTIAASGTLSLAAGAQTCSLQLHVPGNLLRFQTAGGLMVSTVVIVTSPSGRYLSTSITACRAADLQPCAIRAVAAAKLALLVATPREEP